MRTIELLIVFRSIAEFGKILADRMLLFVSRCVIRGFDVLGLHGALATICVFFVKPVSESCKHDASPDVYTLLVLDAERFRGDLEVFSFEPNLRLLKISPKLLLHLLSAFLPVSELFSKAPTLSLARPFFFNAPAGGAIEQGRVRYRKFLRVFLPELYKKCGIDLVISNDLRYRRNADLCWMSFELGYPHICLQRESLFIFDAVFGIAVRRHRMLGPFRGDVIAVHNEITKDMLLASGCCSSEQIEIVGSVRMDEFQRRIAQTQDTDTRKQIVFFSSPTAVQDLNGNKFDFSEALTGIAKALGRVALARPDVPVLIKMKDIHLKGKTGGNVPLYEDAIRAAVGEIPPNIAFVKDRMAAHQMIMDSSVIVAMQSTVVLEAAISGKPVILPHFKSLRDRPDADRFLMYKNQHHLFDVPDSEADLVGLLLERLDDPHIEPEIVEQRWELFGRYVSPRAVSARQKNIDLLCKWARKGRSRRAQQTCAVPASAEYV